MRKFEIMTVINEKIFNISNAYSSRIHDFKFRKMSDHISKYVQVFADSGYQGLQEQHLKTFLQHKLRRKSSLAA